MPEAVLPEWKDTLGLDVVYLAANHMSDRGVAGIRSTLRLLDKHGIPRTGLGMNLDEALEPAYVDVAGLKVALRRLERRRRRRRARTPTPRACRGSRRRTSPRPSGGRATAARTSSSAIPQWWGGREYHNDLLPKQVKQLGWFDAAGCDHVVGVGHARRGPDGAPPVGRRRRSPRPRLPRQLRLRAGLLPEPPGGRDPRAEVRRRAAW